MTLVEKTEGTSSLHYALLVGDIAILPAHTENYETAIALLRQALAVTERVSPSEDMTNARERLAEILRREKLYQEAEPLLLDALEGLDKQKRQDPISKAAALNNLAVLRFDQERYQEFVDMQQLPSVLTANSSTITTGAAFLKSLRSFSKLRLLALPIPDRLVRSQTQSTLSGHLES